LLGSVSRAASLDDISKWNITQLDTLAALMEADDGTWETAQVEGFSNLNNLRVIQTYT